MKHRGKTILPLLLCLTVFCACASDSSDLGESGSAGQTDSPPASSGGFLDLSDAALLLDENASSDVKKAAGFVKGALISAGVAVRVSEPEDFTSGLLIGRTDRPESQTAQASLPDGSGFALTRSGDCLSLVGSDDEGLIRACEYFVNRLAGRIRDGRLEMEEDYRYMESYDSTVSRTESLFGIETVRSVEIYGPTKSDPAPELTYARILELSHNGENNGTLIATCESLHVRDYLIHKSADGGKTFEQIGKIGNQRLITNWQPMLYELPHALGDLPEGTLLLAGCSRNEGTTHTEMTIFYSPDLGKSWKTLSTVAKGGGFGQVNGMSNGLWEPFLLMDNGRLYCFYSDETDCLNHSQMIVCRSSEDGINWSETQRIVACADRNLRPGMASVAKMGNGKYFLTYEMVGMPSNPVYFKTTDDLSDWGDPSENGTRVQTPDGVGIGSTPYCAWIPAGSDCGTLMVTAKNMAGGRSDTGTDWLISADYGRTFTAIPNPLPYREGEFRYAYSPCIFPAADGQTVYYVNNINSEAVPSKAKMQLAILKIHGFGEGKRVSDG